MIDYEIFSKQKLALIILVGLLLLMSFWIYKPSKKYKKEDLLVDINKATYIELIKVPYIGEKTAEKIIKLREEKGYFNSIEDLKKIRNFKKFKYYIKVEKDAP